MNDLLYKLFNKIKTGLVKYNRQLTSLGLIYSMFINSMAPAFAISDAYIDVSRQAIISGDKILKQQATLKEFSDSDNPITPTISLEVLSNSSQYNGSVFDTPYVDLDVPTGSNSQDKIKIISAAVGTDFASIVELMPGDNLELYYPHVMFSRVLLSDAGNLRADSLNRTYFKSAAISFEAETLAAITNDNNLFIGNINGTPSLNQTNIKTNGYIPVLISPLPNQKKKFVLLNVSPGGFNAKSNSLKLISPSSNSDNLLKLNNIQGKTNEQSIVISTDSPAPFYIKYKSNKFLVTEGNDPENFIGFSYYSHNLKSKTIKNYLDKIVNLIPAFTNSTENVNKFLTAFNGFSLFSIPSNFDKQNLHSKTFKNFYFDELPNELKSNNDGTQRHIAGATIFRDPKTNQIYLAISTFDTKALNNNIALLKTLKRTDIQKLFCKIDEKDKFNNSSKKKLIAKESEINFKNNEVFHTPISLKALTNNVSKKIQSTGTSYPHTSFIYLDGAQFQNKLTNNYKFNQDYIVLTQFDGGDTTTTTDGGTTTTTDGGTTTGGSTTTTDG